MKSRLAEAELSKDRYGTPVKETRETDTTATCKPRSLKPGIQAQRSQQRDDMSIVCHELLSPLALIKAYTAILLEMKDTITVEEQSQYIHGIDSASDKLVKLLEELRDTDRQQIKDIPLGQSISLIRLIDKALSEMKQLTSRHTFRFHPHVPLPHILVASEKIEQVINNLLSNAVKYSPNGGGIDVDLRLARTEAELGRICYAPLLKVPCYIVSIADRGLGVPENELSRIFEKFYRVDNKFVRSTPGVGLGLYICRTIIESYGGRIWAMNRSGGGSVFSFSLPLETEAPGSV